ncbi:hypothetical protein [Proteus terrae]|uniref:hypothetical protein n=1 Tax=Proteus terrae TaxID=1574161 RepID=UPI001C5E4759|nr:hypothetical protein [Proteus terrae]
MNKSDARKIAQTITSEQLNDMFERAKRSITNWEIKSKVNPQFSIGATWNIFYSVYTANKLLHVTAKANMIREFGDYLDESLKPVKKSKRGMSIKIHHEEPIFTPKGGI